MGPFFEPIGETDIAAWGSSNENGFELKINKNRAFHHFTSRSFTRANEDSLSLRVVLGIIAATLAAVGLFSIDILRVETIGVLAKGFVIISSGFVSFSPIPQSLCRAKTAAGCAAVFLIRIQKLFHGHRHR